MHRAHLQSRGGWREQEHGGISCLLEQVGGQEMCVHALHINLLCFVGKRPILGSCARNQSYIIRVVHKRAINVAKQDQTSHVDQC